jgi:hypothetical protein
VVVSPAQAREILGPDCLALDDVCGALDLSTDTVPAHLRQIAETVHFSADELREARDDGQMLVFRLASDAAGPLTIHRLIERFPSLFDPKLLTKVGYALRDEWGITLEPLAKTEVCKPGWHLARKAPLPSSLNLSYYEQEAVLPRAGSHSPPRRRTAVEAIFDLIVHHSRGGERLLAESFDWTSSRTVDAGYLYVGGFGEQGMTIVGFSAAVRHATLGLCPTRGVA